MQQCVAKYSTALNRAAPHAAHKTVTVPSLRTPLPLSPTGHIQKRLNRSVVLRVRAQSSGSPGSSGPTGANAENLPFPSGAGDPSRNPSSGKFGTAGGLYSGTGATTGSGAGGPGGRGFGGGGSGGSGGSSSGGAGGPGGSNFFTRNWMQLTAATVLLGWPLYSWYRRTYVDPQHTKSGPLDSAKEAAQAAKSTVYHGYEATKEGAEHAVHKVTDPVVDAAHRVTGTGQRTKDTLAAKGQDAYEAAEDRWQDTKDAASRKAGQAMDRGQEAANAAKAKSQEAADEVADQSREKTSSFWESLRGGITGGADKAAHQAHAGVESAKGSVKRVGDVRSPAEASEEETRKRVLYSVGAVAAGLAVVGAAYWWDLKKGGEGKGADGKVGGNSNSPTTFA